MYILSSLYMNNIEIEIVFFQILFPGLYKLFDEGVVNCRDHVKRMETAIIAKKENIHEVTKINITISIYYEFIARC